MEKALRAAGADVEAVYVEDEGHGFHAEANRRLWFTRLLGFLAEHLGGAPAKS
jgi:dipeptidyl aminopeptidase/acylaminoacyl peptidase